MKIHHPTLLLDQQKCLRNIKRMADKARRHNLHFRPHFKTHQSAVIGNWFRDYGVNAITVTSVRMATYFAGNGWDDITIAMPVNLAETDDIDTLAGRINLNVLVESDQAVNHLAKNLKNTVGVFIEIDTGSHRTGIDSAAMTQVASISEKIITSGKLNFKGLLTHAGHSYRASGRSQIESIHYDSVEKMKRLKDNLSQLSTDISLSIGDTPCCSIMDDFIGIDEIRPGNFVFYDVMQYKIGSCDPDEIAVVMACPVIAKYPQRNELVIYGGAVHFSKDHIVNENGNSIYGFMMDLHDGQWKFNSENTYLSSVSQEHGIVKAPQEIIQSFDLGDTIGIMPVHSCLTAACMGSYVTLTGERIDTMNKSK